mmetsp:Transcript_4612/g.6814  ORF Transcript_4612/g.6814 Transcript_4612/m.6814 type:complete len:518 (+) Transcript_4612:131-1684(+)
MSNAGNTELTPLVEETPLSLSPSAPASSYGGTTGHDHDGVIAEIGEGGGKIGSEHDNGATTSTHTGAHNPSIGMWGSMSIAVNSLTGPAMLTLPATFQRSGLIPTTFTLLSVAGLSALCSLHMADTISKVPGNKHYKHEIEFSEAFEKFWGHRWFLVTQFLYFGCVTCLNMSSIVDTSQVVDTFLGHHLPQGSFAFQFFGPEPQQNGIIHFIRWSAAHCTQDELLLGDCIPFMDDDDDGSLLLTGGYMMAALIFFPLCLLDLKENASWQIFGFLVLLITSVQFIISFCATGIDFERVSLWGTSWNSLFGVVLFNFALVIAIPAWLYEKHPSIDVPTVIHGSTALSTLMYVLIGFIGAIAIPNVSDNMLESMMSGAFGPIMAGGATLFAFFIIGLGIPLFSVLTRMSLLGTNLCSSPRQANLWSVYMPWCCSWLVYHGVTHLLAWGGVLFTSAVAFILPLLLSLHTIMEFYDETQGSITVYNNLFVETKESETLALYILLALASGAVFLAIVGLIVGD